MDGTDHTVEVMVLSMGGSSYRRGDSDCKDSEGESTRGARWRGALVLFENVTLWLI